MVYHDQQITSDNDMVSYGLPLFSLKYILVAMFTSVLNIVFSNNNILIIMKNHKVNCHIYDSLLCS